MGLTPADISSSRAMLQRGDEIRQAQERHVEAARLRDTFAAAALTGLLAAPTDKDRSMEYWARLAYEAADAMLRERVTEPMPKEKRAEVSYRYIPDHISKQTKND